VALTILALGVTHVAAFLAGAWVLHRGRTGQAPVVLRQRRIEVSSPQPEPRTVMRAPVGKV
jgi:hypothetical protein